MEATKLTDRHFCYVIFLEMPPIDFVNLLETNGVIDNLKYLDCKYHRELYEEAKERMVVMNLGQIYFDFDYDSEPFVFNKYIGSKLDRAYKICVFEYGEDENCIGKTSNFENISDVFLEGMPLFFDTEGKIIRNSLN